MSGEAARDRGVARVLNKESALWHANYVRFCAEWFWALPPGATFKGEELRLNALRRGLPEPHNPNVWGAASLGYLKALFTCGMAETVGTSKALSAKSHAHQYRIYRKLGKGDA
jgi:hypothetical protein